MRWAERFFSRKSGGGDFRWPLLRSPKRSVWPFLA